MKILFLTTVAVDPTKGGIERVTRTLADELLARGHTVFFVAMMDCYRESSDPALQHFFPNPKIYSAENEVFLKNFLREKQIDVVVFQSGDDKRIPFPHIYKEAGTRLIVAVHTDPDFYKALVRSKIELKFGRKMPLVSSALARLKILLRKRKQAKIYSGHGKYADAVVLLSSKFIPIFSQYIRKKDEKKVVAIPNILPPLQKMRERQSRPNTQSSLEEKEIIYVGRIDLAAKRTDLLLHIWKKICESEPEWKLRIVGDGADAEKIKTLAGTLGLKNVFFEGFQNPEQYYAKASVLCLTSAYEGFPMVLLEAAAFGCVPVAFDSFAAVHDIVSDGENGVLVPAFDCEKYAEKLAELMENSALRERLAKNALAIPEKFSPEKIGDKWEKLFRRCIEHNA